MLFHGFEQSHCTTKEKVTTQGQNLLFVKYSVMM